MMKLTKNIKNLLIGLVILIIIGIFFFMRRKNASTYMVPEDNNPGSDYSALYAIYNQRLLTCSDTYNMAADKAAALSTYNTCLSSNVLFLTSNSCPPAITTTVSGVTSRTYTTYESCTAGNGSGASARYCSDLVTWKTSNIALTNDQTNIRNAYIDMISRAGKAAGSNTYPVQSIIEMARKADMRAASNKYLSNLCPSFFKTQSNTVPVGGASPIYTTHNPTNYFKNYSTTSTGGTYYLDDTNRLNSLGTVGGTQEGQIAAGILTEWAKNAGNTDNELSIPNAAISGFAGTTRYSIADGSGYFGTAVDSQNATCIIPNWVMALYFGPGTIAKTPTDNSKIPITWSDSANTTKTCYYTPPGDGIIHRP